MNVKNCSLLTGEKQFSSVGFVHVTTMKTINKEDIFSFDFNNSKMDVM